MLASLVMQSAVDHAMVQARNKRQTDVWDEAIEVAARRYRGRAQDPGDLPFRRRQRRKDRRLRADRSHQKIKPEVERYERAAKVAMEIAMKVSDDLLRDAAVRQIVELCLKANDTRRRDRCFAPSSPNRSATTCCAIIRSCGT